jgi:hypothetical protein
MAIMRKKRNFIQSLQTLGGLATSQQDKHSELYQRFNNHIGTYAPRQISLNLSNLEWQPRNLSHLEAPIIEQEVATIVKGAPKDKAPGPDGFIGLFFSLCWDVIKKYFMRAVEQFFNLNQQGLQLLNQAYIVLIPKKTCPLSAVDFRPISLTHSFAKIITKILANRLGPELEHLISRNQIAFVKKICIQDSFVYVQQTIKLLYKKKIPALFIKLDISKALDTFNWPFLLGIMARLGFGQRWRNWISLLLCTSSSKILLNGEPGQRMLHSGVRQGDPLSPIDRG